MWINGWYSEVRFSWWKCSGDFGITISKPCNQWQLNWNLHFLRVQELEKWISFSKSTFLPNSSKIPFLLFRGLNRDTELSPSFDQFLRQVVNFTNRFRLRATFLIAHNPNRSEYSRRYKVPVRECERLPIRWDFGNGLSGALMSTSHPRGSEYLQIWVRFMLKNKHPKPRMGMRSLPLSWSDHILVFRLLRVGQNFRSLQPFHRDLSDFVTVCSHGCNNFRCREFNLIRLKILFRLRTHWS